jgi:DNA-directed RNA polymerase specialized sigma24 family protein
VVTAARFDVALCEALVAGAIGGDERARRELVEHLWPSWLEMVRGNRSMGSLAASEDAVHNVVMRLIEKVGSPDSRGLSLYRSWRERNPDRDFGDWIRIVTKNAVRDHVRERLGASATPGEPSVKRLLNEFASSQALEELGARPPITAAQTARELLDFARARLPGEQLDVLRAWLDGDGFDEIAAARGQGADDVRRSLRAAVAVLRRHFAAGAEHTPA